ncbi:hypothetical protein ACR715_18315, partial [Xenorhabdus bovienii]
MAELPVEVVEEVTAPEPKLVKLLPGVTLKFYPHHISYIRIIPSDAWHTCQRLQKRFQRLCIVISLSFSELHGVSLDIG